MAVLSYIRFSSSSIVNRLKKQFYLLKLKQQFYRIQAFVTVLPYIGLSSSSIVYGL